MGKPSRSQPAHADIDAAASVRSPHRRRPRSKTVSRQRDSVTLPIKLPVPSVSVSPSEPPSPSPLTELMDEEFYDATDEFPDEDGDLFYESYQGVEHKPALPTVQQVIPEPEYDGAAKGRCDRGRTATHSRHMAPTSTPTPTPAAPPAFSFPSTFLSPAPPPGPAPIPTRGLMKTTVNLTSGPVATTLVHEEARKAVPQLPIFQRKPVKKALVVGMNYASWGKDGRLYYAVKDAKLWRDTFVGKGVESDNIKIITDEGDVQDAPTFENLLNHIRWLVSGATSGDSLFFVYSGHAVKHQNYGPSIMTADKLIFPRPVLERELVMSIPAGVDLQVVFDCCHSAGMIGLQFCVGRMAKPTLPSDSHAEESATCPPEHESQTALPRQNFLGSPQHASLYGLPAADAALPPRPPPVTPETVEQDTFGAPPQRPPRGGVVAAPPMAAPAPAAGTQTGAAMGGAVRFLGSLIGIGSSVPTPAPAAAPPPLPPPSELPTARPGPRRACQGVVEGARIPDYFEERKEGFVAPAGKVMVWAGTGEAQKAFESYGGVRQGVVTKAMCAAFERITTRRDLWSYLVQEIESENTLRSNRDANKSISERPLPSSRIQHAELWVSQAHVTTLRSAAPVLDQPII